MRRSIQSGQRPFQNNVPLWGGYGMPPSAARPHELDIMALSRHALRSKLRNTVTSMESRPAI